MGDDERNEYIYRYVSNLPWRRARRQGINPLDDGVLYVAKFHESGFGEWLALTPANPALAAWSLNDILINTRAAADAVGATMMDRPEWIDTFPHALTAIGTLTNNNRRGTTPVSVNNPDGTTVGGFGTPAGGCHQSARQQRLRSHHYMEVPKGLDRADVRVGDFHVGRRSGGAGPRLGHRRRQVRLARRHLRRAERQALDPDRCVSLDHQYR